MPLWHRAIGLLELVPYPAMRTRSASHSAISRPWFWPVERLAVSILPSTAVPTTKCRDANKTPRMTRLTRSSSNENPASPRRGPRGVPRLRVLGDIRHRGEEHRRCRLIDLNRDALEPALAGNRVDLNRRLGEVGRQSGLQARAAR